MLTAINIIHAIMLFLLLLEAVFVLRQTPSKSQNLLLIMIISTGIMVIGYTLEINSSTLEAAMMANTVGYIGKPFAMLTGFLLITECFGYSSYIKKWQNGLLLGISLATVILVCTSRFQNLFYTTIEFTNEGSFFPHLVLGHGLFYYFYIALIFFYPILETAICINEFRYAETAFERQQIGFIMGVVFSAVIGLIPYLLDITGGYDTTIFGSFFGIALLSVLFYKYRVFDVVQSVKDHALNSSGNGILVFDQSDKVIYSNKTIKDIFPMPGNHSVKNLRNYISNIRSFECGDGIYQLGDRFYHISERPLISNGRTYGGSIELNDITDSLLYSRRLEYDVSERIKEIKRIQRHVTIAFANIVEARDSGTGEHIMRTSTYVRILAGSLRNDSPYMEEMTDEYIRMLEETSPLHDVGKVSIPDNILLKPGKLTPDEFEVIKKHTTLGKGLIEKTMRGVESDEYVSMASDISLYHHERWNGLGYPMGLAGNDIPLCARIMSIADVYDALRSKRCYKDAMSHAAACEIIYNESGMQFDPVIVKAFMRIETTFELENLKSLA